mmetsp:Transcript_1454/g.4764  ORF Transcript_1454/g.4764 Transcript_1454/m.4764 type:complete len:230 (+) Transcript_1454:3-692(+)
MWQTSGGASCSGQPCCHAGAWRCCSQPRRSLIARSYWNAARPFSRSMAAELHEPSMRSDSSRTITGHVWGVPSDRIRCISERSSLAMRWIWLMVRNITTSPPCWMASRHASSVAGVSSSHRMPLSHSSSISLSSSASTAPSATHSERTMLPCSARAHACICVPRMVHARSSHKWESWISLVTSAMKASTADLPRCTSPFTCTIQVVEAAPSRSGHGGRSRRRRAGSPRG